MAKRKKKQVTEIATTDAAQLSDPGLLADIRQLIATARQRIAQAVNSTLVVMYWQIGRRIREDVLEDDRAEYGKQIVATLSKELTEEYGRGFGRRNLLQMVQFAEVSPEKRIAQTLSAQLSWSHFVELIPLDDPLKREFYAEMCRVERWSVRTLRHKIGHLLYERTAIAKKPADLIEQDLAALHNEDRMTPDLVESGEEPPLGLILCADKSTEHVELSQLEEGGIRVAQYLTDLPSKELLERKLHESIQLARERLARADQQRLNADAPSKEAPDE